MTKTMTTHVKPKPYNVQLIVISATFFLLLCVASLLIPAQVNTVFLAIRDFVIRELSWALMLVVAIVFIFMISLMFGKFGDIKLGKDTDTPEFSFSSWVAMLFSAGMGIGFVFFAVAEPMNHLYYSSHVIDAGIAGTIQAGPKAVSLTIFDWGMHAYALFALGGFAIAFPAYRLGRPLSIAGGLYGILGERCYTSMWGKLADVVGTIAAIGGIAASIGMATASLSYAIFFIFDVKLSSAYEMVLMLFFVVGYSLCTVVGIQKGMRILSNLNMIFAALILTALIFLGNAPASYVLNMVVQSFGEYISSIPYLTFWTDAGQVEQRDWLGWWVIFNWMWWATYLPFVGGFIARISKGRTLKEFVFGVIFIPVILTTIWYSIWGAQAIYTQTQGFTDIISHVDALPQSGVFVLLDTIQFGEFLAILLFVNLIVFAVTTADSAALFISIQMTNGNPNPSSYMRLIWGIVIGLTGATFHIVGGMGILKSLATIIGVPVVAIMIAYIFSIKNMLKLAKAGKL